MGRLIEGKWCAEDGFVSRSTDGRFRRAETTFRSWITPDGSPGPSGEGGFPAARGRYHLYVSYACPWAHRTLIVRALKGLADTISASPVDPLMLEMGWTFGVDTDSDESTRDPIEGRDYLHQIYQLADRHATTRATVPILWDKEQRTIVSNESSEIIRMLGSAFDGLGATALELYPASLREEIDAINARVYEDVNNGVYRAGFAGTQAAYEESFDALFATLDWLEARLAGRAWLVGDQLTEADIRLFTTAIRFDSVYHTHFKCNRNKIAEMPNLWAHTRRIYALPGMAETVNFDHIRRHYYGSHRSLNPRGIVARGPELAL